MVDFDFALESKIRTIMVAHEARFPLYAQDPESFTEESEDGGWLDWAISYRPRRLWSESDVRTALSDGDMVLADVSMVAAWYGDDGYPVAWGKLASFETLRGKVGAYEARSSHNDKLIVINVLAFAEENPGVYRQILARGEGGSISPYEPLDESLGFERTWEYVRTMFRDPSGAPGWWLMDNGDLIPEYQYLIEDGHEIDMKVFVDLVMAYVPSAMIIPVRWDHATPAIDHAFARDAIRKALRTMFPES